MQVLEEIRFHHEQQLATRDAELRRREAIQRQLEESRRLWDVARDHAVGRFRKQFVIDSMHAQAKRWNEANELRRYAGAIRRHASELDDELRAKAIEWAEQIEGRSDGLDPLPEEAARPTLFPEPSLEDLKPYMGGFRTSRP